MSEQTWGYLTVRPTLRSRMLSAALAAALGALSLSTAATTARADSTPEASSSGLPLDEARASAQAQATGKAVSVDAATTPTESEVANPDGTFTLLHRVDAQSLGAHLFDRRRHL